MIRSNLKGLTLSACILALCAGGTAYGQDTLPSDVDLSAVQVDTGGYIRVGLGAVESEDGDTSLEPVVDVSIRAEMTAITESGTEYGAGAEVRGQREVGQRSFGGRAGDCPPGVGDCPSITLNNGVRAATGHTGGFFGAGEDITGDSGAELERAYVFLRNGYGEFIAGRDDGAASLFSLGAPRLNDTGRPSNASVDYTGLAGVRTLNDASGFAEKLTYISPRMGGDQIGVGVQLGVSYSPDVEVCGVDYCVRPNSNNPLQPLSPELANVVEFGAALDRRFENGFEVEASATYARGEEDSALAAFDNFSSAGAGVEFRFKGFTLGASYLGSNNGWDGDGNYTAYDLGLAYERDRLGFMVGVGQASDNLAHVDALSAQAGINYKKDNVTVGGGVQVLERGVPSVTLSGRTEAEEDAAVVFIEGAIDF